MSSNVLRADAKIEVTITKPLADPLILAPSTCGAVLSRWLSGDIEETRITEYRRWVERFIENHRNGEAVVRPDGDLYINALEACAEGRLGSGAFPVARELAEKLCDGGLSVVKARGWPT